MERAGSASHGGHAARGEFGATLLSLRVAAGFSQFDLAERSGVSVRTISDLERGRRSTPHAASARLLADALGLTGDQRDFFFDAVNQGRRLGRASSAPDRASSQSPASDLDAILGRADDLATIERRLAAGDRLLTLLGPGGVGKSRLAREVADRLLAAGKPVIWVPLDAISDPALVLPVIARATGISSTNEANLAEAIATALGNEPPLLVLDNMEHLTGAAATISHLLAASPKAQALVTSREALRLAGERVLPVNPLPVPDPRTPQAALAGNPAVALFLRVLAASSLGRNPSADDAAIAATIVRLVDGLPLAIELAAAQGVTLPLASIVTLLESRGLSALARGRRDGPARFHTMEAAIGWSAEMLPAPAQRLFRLLATFRGSFTAEAVLAVATQCGEPSLLGALPALAEAQLVQAIPQHPGRLHLLEPVRMYAQEELQASGHAPAARKAHAAHYLSWAQEQARLVAGTDPLPALDAIDEDLPNVLAALAVACDPATADVDAALATSSALCQYWEIRSRFREGRSALAAAVAAAGPNPTPTPVLMDAIFYAGYLGYFQTDLETVRRTRAQLAPLAEASGLPEYRVRIIILDVLIGDLAGAAPADLLPPVRVAFASIADLEQRVSWQQCLLLNANLTMEIGDLEGAIPLFRTYAEWAIRRGEAIHARGAAHWLGLALLQLGRLEEARRQLIASLEGSVDTRPMVSLFMTVLGLGIANSGPDAGVRRLSRAARLHGAFDELSSRHAFGLTALQERLRQDSRARLIAALGRERFEDLVAEGRMLGTDAVLDLARG